MLRVAMLLAMVSVAAFGLNRPTEAWRGGDGKWEDAACWEGDAIPSAEDSVSIGSGTVLLTRTTVVDSLCLGAHATLRIEGARTLYVRRRLVVDGTVELGAGRLESAGSVKVSGVVHSARPAPAMVTNWTGSLTLTNTAGVNGTIVQAPQWTVSSGMTLSGDTIQFLQMPLSNMTLPSAPAADPSAREKVWRGPADGDWDDAANWSPEGVPQPGDTVVLRTDPILRHDARVAGLRVEAGSALVLEHATLTVKGDAEVRGQVRLVGGRLRVRGLLSVEGSGEVVGPADFLPKR